MCGFPSFSWSWVPENEVLAGLFVGSVAVWEAKLLLWQSPPVIHAERRKFTKKSLHLGSVPPLDVHPCVEALPPRLNDHAHLGEVKF
jgi:hypothetical protein